MICYWWWIFAKINGSWKPTAQVATERSPLQFSRTFALSVGSYPNINGEFFQVIRQFEMEDHVRKHLPSRRQISDSAQEIYDGHLNKIDVIRSSGSLNSFIWVPIACEDKVCTSNGEDQVQWRRKRVLGVLFSSPWNWRWHQVNLGKQPFFSAMSISICCDQPKSEHTNGG